GRIVREMSQELSALRDAEVVEQLLPLRAQDAGEALSRSAAAQLVTMARENREAQITAARRRLLSSGHQESLRALGEMLDRARLSESAAERTPKKLGSRMTERWLETVRQLGPVPAETVELEDVLVHVHAVRRALRLLSFGSEVFELTALRARKSQVAVLPSAEGYLETCGELMDCRVMDLWYASAARALVRKGGDRYGVGILHGRERARLEASAEDSVLLLEDLFGQLEGED
ncbi:UNVERIFIED_CONTAM: CHAD domain-containing protein, partial [Kocuria sp. CPCC 205295]